MALASGTVTFSRFLIPGNPLGEITDQFVAALNEYAFGRRGSADENVQVGWISARHLFDHELTGEKIAFGRYAFFAMRVDSLRVPPNVARSYIQMEQEVAHHTAGKQHLSKAELVRARDAARLRIEQETRSGMFRRMTSCPLLIDLETNTLCLGTTGTAAAQRLIELFGNTFSRALVPADADQLAERLLRKNTRALEQIEPFFLVESPGGDGALPPADFRFLGKEFLTWLWYMIDSGESSLTLHRRGDVSVMIDRVLRLECDFRMTGTDVITADGPAGLPEAHAALRVGKQPTRMGLVISSRLGDLSLVLDGPRLAISGLILPVQGPAEPSPREALEQRFEQIFDAADLIELLYQQFLHRRVAANWPAALREMANWARGVEKSSRREVATAS